MVYKMVNISQTASEILVEELTWREQDVLNLLIKRLTNQEIAKRLSLAESTIKGYVGNILLKLNVENRRQAVQRAISLGLVEHKVISKGKLKSNIPAPMNSFIGRQTELKKILSWFDDPSSKLLTLTGPPGTGKTRLAQEAGKQAINKFKNGVVFVSLASIIDPQIV
jgi:ATP/maltotriose-dependent transcriptional regulator MalT